ncbi:HET-domain-containing protein, partial [Melanomma pulvis-pyrius CBS 109.77]
LPYHTGSNESLNLARKWLRNCTIHHGVCCASQDEIFRPSRLLYLENDSVCIHTTRDMPKRVSYLTLSHCWGKLHIIRLLKSNEQSFQQNLPWAYLPKTFQDAIRITRHLGFSYLWIDSLTIIQDSSEDWNHEAKLMGKIYKNAACNIAASDAPDSRHGCLYPRNPRTLQPEVVRLKTDDEKYLINETDIYDNHILYTRAWVLQEALLARRTLDCGRGQLFWRCGEMRASEVFPGGVPTNVYHEDHPASKFKAISAEQDQIMLNRYTDAPFAFWASIVEQYTEMGITKDTDRIIALAGITDVFRPFFGEHCFGMWRIFMPLELLWGAGRTKQPSTTRAPSWSWLSIEGPVFYSNCEFKYGRDGLVTQFIDAEMTGEHGMQLRLSTPLLRAKWGSWTDATRSGSICSIEGISDDYAIIYFDHWSDPGDFLPAEDIFCMCIQIHKEYRKTRTMGLVLEEVEHGVFRRLGHFSSNGELIIPFLKQTPTRALILV